MDRRPIAALAAAIVLIGGSPAARGASCSDGGCSCPQYSSGWNLYLDANRGVPDFWFVDSLVVQEIAVCEHGIRFRFRVEQDENPHLAALVIVGPDENALKQRLGPPRSVPQRPAEIEHFRRRVTQLRSDLERLFKTPVEAGQRLDFRSAPLRDRPVILQ
ncbi:MAG: hypothetical protein GF328_02835, partial [Candidatus Latescibacteria bacterium]|nr:hypothetical protein [Candidatus Latescibacterota bacterium]